MLHDFCSASCQSPRSTAASPDVRRSEILRSRGQVVGLAGITLTHMYLISNMLAAFRIFQETSLEAGLTHGERVQGQGNAELSDKKLDSAATLLSWKAPSGCFACAVASWSASNSTRRTWEPSQRQDT